MAEKMAAICIRAALNLHTDGSDPLLIIVFSVITRPQYIKKQGFIHVHNHLLMHPYIHPLPVLYLDCVNQAASPGDKALSLQILPGS